MDPASFGLMVKTGSLALKAQRVLQRLARWRTEAFVTERDEMHRAWTAETAGRLSEHLEQSRDAFLLLDRALEEHERKLDELLNQPEVEVLAALYAEAAYREAISDRRVMLSHAAAAIVDLDVGIVEKCRVEKDLRALDPDDVLELDRLDRLVGNVQRTGIGTGRKHFHENRHRHIALSESRASDALLSSGCMRSTGEQLGGDVAVVTARGRIILHLLRSYIATRQRQAPGRETVPGERGEAAARALLASGLDFQSSLAKVAALARAGRENLTAPWFRREYRVQFDFPKPQAKRDDRDDQPLDEPRPDSWSRLHITPAQMRLAERVVATVPAGFDATANKIDGSDVGVLQVTGPFDLLRWLAEDIGASWT
jgi:hypothetical protein